MTISVNPYGGVFGVRKLGSYRGDSDLTESVNRYDVKKVKFNPDLIETRKTLKWNKYSVVREYQYGPKSLTPRFGLPGDFYLTGRLREQKVLEGTMNSSGDIVELKHIDINAIKEMRKDFPYVERFLRKLSKFIVR